MDISFGSGIPGAVERAHQDRQVEEAEADVNMMPPSPSPAKIPAGSEHSNRNSLIPHFELQPQRNGSSPRIVIGVGLDRPFRGFGVDNV